jgi:hypothetical protein
VTAAQASTPPGVELVYDGCGRAMVRCGGGMIAVGDDDLAREAIRVLQAVRRHYRSAAAAARARVAAAMDDAVAGQPQGGELERAPLGVAPVSEVDPEALAAIEDPVIPPDVTGDDPSRVGCRQQRDGYTCTAELGHPGPHAAYSGPDDLCETWPQEAAAAAVAAAPAPGGGGLAAVAGSVACLAARECVAAYDKAAAASREEQTLAAGRAVIIAADRLAASTRALLAEITARQAGGSGG